MRNSRVGPANVSRAIHDAGLAEWRLCDQPSHQDGSTRWRDIRIGRITNHALIRLKRFYGMPAATMLIQLRDVGLLSEATVYSAFRTYARTWRAD